jgi:CDP-glucose 4,6-dehydratase
MMTNSMGTVNVLEMIRTKEHIAWAVMITTDKVYENKEWIYPYQETDRLGWHDPYSSSKAMAEIAIESYTKSFFKTDKKIAVVRAGNVIGGWDWSEDRLLPDIVKTMMKWEKITLRNPNAVRPWQYVLEALYGYLIIWEKIFSNDKYCGAYNFWPDISDTLKVIDLVTASVKILWKWSYEIDESMNQGMHEAWLLLLDNTKAKTLLGWSPQYNVKEVLEKTLNWYSMYYNQRDAIEAWSLAEINNFTT